MAQAFYSNIHCNIVTFIGCFSNLYGYKRPDQKKVILKFFNEKFIPDISEKTFAI